MAVLSQVASPGAEGSGRVTRARTKAMQGMIKSEPGVTADGSGSSVGSPSSSRGYRAPVIRSTPPVREVSPLPEPMESRGSAVEVTREGSAAEIDEPEYIVNSEDSQISEWEDDRLAEDCPLTGTRSWTDTSSDLLKVTFRPNFKKSDITEIIVHSLGESREPVTVDKRRGRK